MISNAGFDYNLFPYSENEEYRVMEIFHEMDYVVFFMFLNASW